MKYSTDYCVYIGRFQPLTPAHLQTMLIALQESRELIVLIGSPNRSLSVQNPFTLDERIEIIQAAFQEAEVAHRVKVLPIPDSAYNFTAWTAKAQELVSHVTGKRGKVKIIGHFKDDSSYYLSHFPMWELIQLPSLADKLSATQIRERIFQGDSSWEDFYPPDSPEKKKIGEILEVQKERFENLREEYRFLEGYKKKWEAAPFPPVFVTTDAVVFCKGHVLLIRRKLNPGKGKLALPGGFLDQKETLVEGCLRELREETKIDVPLPILRSSITNQKVFDHPNRDPRGRAITHGYLIELNLRGALPEIRAADDAKEVHWVPLADLDQMAMEFFNDHMMIILYFLGRSM